MLNKPGIVLDTNVLVSSLFGGRPYEVVSHIADDRITLHYSLPIYEEYFRIFLSEKFKIPKELREKILGLIREYGVLVNVLSVSHECRDAHDNKFIECAIDAKSDFIVSGDKHLLELHKTHGIEILDPAGFLRRMKF